MRERPKEEALLGIWKLKNSPPKPVGSPCLPSTKETYIHLKQDGIAEVNGLLVEERLWEQPVTTRWLIKTAQGSWAIESWPDGDHFSWRVQLRFQEAGQEAVLKLYSEGRNQFQLRYSPDPEMAAPFVFARE